MGLLQDIVHAISGNHAGGPVAAPMMKLQAPQGLSAIRSMLPMAPRPVNGQVSPQSQALYQHMLNQTGRYTPQQVHGMQPQYGMHSNYSTPIQGVQNPGYTPMQGSRGVMPIQGGMSAQPFNVQSNNNYNPQPNIQF